MVEQITCGVLIRVIRDDYTDLSEYTEVDEPRKEDAHG